MKAPFKTSSFMAAKLIHFAALAYIIICLQNSQRYIITSGYNNKAINKRNNTWLLDYFLERFILKNDSPNMHKTPSDYLKTCISCHLCPF